MKRQRLSSPENSANDNVALEVLGRSSVQAGPASHVYEFTAEEPRKPKKIRITTNVPGNLPIISQEIALIEGFMSELISHILANDNEFS